MFSNSMVSWFVGSLQSPGCKRVEIGCIFLSEQRSIWGHLRAFEGRPDTFFILVNMGWICSQPNFFNIQSGEILHRLFKSVRILHIGQNCKVEAELNSPNMKSDWINVQKWMILWVTIPFSDQFFSTLLPENIFGPPVRSISVSVV